MQLNYIKIIVIFLFLSSLAVSQDNDINYDSSAEFKPAPENENQDSILTVPIHDISGPFTRYTMQRHELQDLPVRDFNQYLTLFPSAWQRNDQIHVRAGRSNETAYYINGLPLSNPLDNSFAGYIIPEAIESISLLPGSYSARYGLANSGIVMTDIRKGGPEFTASLDIHSDKFAAEGEKFINTYSYQDHYIIAQASGLLYWENLQFYAAYENSDIGDAAKRFSESFYFPNLVDGNTRSQAVMEGNPDTVTLSYPAGFTPDNSRSRWAINARFDLDLNDIQLNFITLYDQLKAYDSRIPMIDLLNGRKFYEDSHRLLLQGGISHRLGKNTSYSVNAAWFSSESETADDITGNDWYAWSDTALVRQLTGGRIVFDDIGYITPVTRYRLHGIDFYRDGALTRNYRHQNMQSFVLNAEINTLINRTHALRAGFDYRNYTLRYYSINPGVGYYLRQLQYTYDNYDTPERILEQYLDNLYGYDLYGRENDSGLNGARKPSYFSIFLEDQVQSPSVCLSLGLRLDRFFNDDRVLRDPANPKLADNYQSWSRVQIAQEEWQEQDALWYLSPRIGLSVDAGKSTRIMAGFSRMVQPPPLQKSYYATYTYDKHIARGGFYYSTPIAFDLTAIQSGLYDFRIEQKIGKVADLSGVLFYKLTEGQLLTDIQRSDPWSDIWTYFRLTNQGSDEIYGCDIRFLLQRVQRVQLVFNYTYTHARSEGASETSNYATLYRQYWVNDSTFFKPSALNPMEFVPEHTATLDLDYRFADKDGGPVLQNLGVNLLLKIDSGLPFTKVYFPPGGSVSFYNMGVDYMVDTRSREPVEPINASTTPWRFNADLRIDKTIRLGRGVSLQLYMRILNLFNSKRVENVYLYSGSAETDGIISDVERTRYLREFYGDTGFDIYNAINTTNSQAYWDEVQNELYLNPRQIFVGMRLVY